MPNQVKDGTLVNDLQTQVSVLGSKVCLNGSVFEPLTDPIVNQFADLGKKGWNEMSSLFGQRSQYTDPNSETSYQNSYQNSYHSEDLFSSSSSSSSTPNHSADVYQRSSNTNESSNLLKESSPQRPKKSPTNGSNSTKIGKEEKLLDFGGADHKKKSSSGNGDWNEGWDDEAWTKLEVEAPKPKKTSKRS